MCERLFDLKIYSCSGTHVVDKTFSMKLPFVPTNGMFIKPPKDVPCTGGKILVEKVVISEEGPIEVYCHNGYSGCF